MRFRFTSQEIEVQLTKSQKREVSDELDDFIEESSRRGYSDGDTMMGFGMLMECGFAVDGSGLTEFGKELVEKFKKARPDLADRVDRFIASGGTSID